jgi:hypothetical protein
MSTLNPIHMSRHRKILIVMGVVLAVAILIPVIHHYQLRAATEAYIAELKTRGEPMELAQVIPLPAPPDQNGVLFITNALANLKYESVAGSNTPPAMRMIVSPEKLFYEMVTDARDVCLPVISRRS